MTATFAPAIEVAQLYRATRDTGGYLKLTQVGNMELSPAPTVEAIDRTDDNTQLDPEGEWISITIWPAGIDRPHGMASITVALEDLISFEVHA